MDDEATARKQEAADKKAKEEGKESTPVEPVMKTVYDDKFDWRVENENKPVWVRNPKDVSQVSGVDRVGKGEEGGALGWGRKARERGREEVTGHLQRLLQVDLP